MTLSLCMLLPGIISAIIVKYYRKMRHLPFFHLYICFDHAFYSITASLMAFLSAVVRIRRCIDLFVKNGCSQQYPSSNVDIVGRLSPSSGRNSKCAFRLSDASSTASASVTPPAAPGTSKNSAHHSEPVSVSNLYVKRIFPFLQIGRASCRERV